MINHRILLDSFHKSLNGFIIVAFRVIYPADISQKLNHLRELFDTLLKYFYRLVKLFFDHERLAEESPLQRNRWFTLHRLLKHFDSHIVITFYIIDLPNTNPEIMDGRKLLDSHMECPQRSVEVIIDQEGIA